MTLIPYENEPPINHSEDTNDQRIMSEIREYYNGNFMDGLINALRDGFTLMNHPERNRSGYIFHLEPPERRRFAQVGHEYLIEQLDYSYLDQNLLQNHFQNIQERARLAQTNRCVMVDFPNLPPELDIWTKQYKEMDVDKNIECPISLQVIDSEYAVCGTCRCNFDYKSIRQWLMRNNNCPMCRNSWINNVKYIENE
jgi:hypothetical protein